MGLQTNRFDLRQLLGRGAFGTVYEAVERGTGTTVALKSMDRTSGAALMRFKAGFRSIADLRHEHLVRMYELFVEDDACYFSMERVDGIDPLRWLDLATDDEPTLATCDLADAAWSPPKMDGSTPAPEGVTPEPAPPGLDPQRVARLFLGIARGVRALHAQGLLHRDLKPANILVEASGRPVLLDFGLTELLGSSSSGLAGTPAYMAPELFDGRPAGPASDWYSVGVILHQALTGGLPAGAPSSQPGPLFELCRALLQPDPEARPGGGSVVSALERIAGVAGVAGVAPYPRASFVGRDAELGALDAALQRVAAGASAAVLVSGESGIGKSRLVREFARRVHRRATVITGRCYQQEILAFKAIDALIDDLARQLTAGQLPPLDPPPGAAALVQLFPVLESALPGLGPVTAPDPQEARSQAIHALTALLAQLASSRPLVLCIDDLQWGDAASGELLTELMGTPRVLFIGSCRSGEEGSGALLPILAEHALEEVVLGALSEEEVAGLVSALVADGRAAAEIAREGDGNPFFLEALIHSHAEGRGTRLRGAIGGRLDALDADARRLLQCVAVAGQPTPRGAVLGAAALPAAAWTVLDDLRAASLVRIRGWGPSAEVESYHNRLREQVVAGLDPAALAASAAGLAASLEETGFSDRARIARYFHTARQPDRARPHALAAAESSAAAFAFERAAGLYALASEGLEPGPEWHRIQTLRADALASAGRGAEAAPLYRSLAGADPGDPQLLRRAAEQWMITGHFDEGLDLVKDLGERAGIPWPRTPLRAVLGALWDMVRLWPFRLPQDLRPTTDPAQLHRIDVCWSALRGLIAVDFVRGVYFITRGMRAAIEAQEPRRLARISLFFGSQLQVMGLKAGTRLFEQGRALAESLADPYLLALTGLQRGYVSLQTGTWTGSAEVLRAAMTRFQGECEDAGWDLTMSQILLCETLFVTGRFEEFRVLVEQAGRRARALGDLNGVQGIGQFNAEVALLDDDPDRARARIVRVLEAWTARGYGYTHAMCAVRLSRYDAYAGAAREGLARLDREWPSLQESGLHRSPYVMLYWQLARARCALVLLAEAPDPALERVVEDAMKKLSRIDRTDARGAVALFGAGLAAHRGAGARAAERLVEARDLFRSDSLESLAAACEARLEPGAATLEALHARGIAAPARWLAAVAPGFPEEPG